MTFFNTLLLVVAALLSSACASPQQQAAIASAHPDATQAGFEILQQGGNAFDAAVAVSAALAVVEPAGSGLGGGGFWLLHDASSGQQIMLDGRETAPGAASADMYLDKAGDVNRDLSLNGPLAAGIPGVPAALGRLSQDYGQLSLATTLAPAIRLAREGFSVTPRYRRMLGFRGEQLNASAKNVLMPGNQLPENGTLIKQPELANTLEMIAYQGAAAFYRGDLARQMVDAVKENGGIWTLQDLANYQTKYRPPVQVEYAGYQFTLASLPSAGGILIANMLHQLTALDYANADADLRLHLLAEVMRRAYRERSEHLGDSDFVSIPDHLTDPAFAQKLAADIDLQQATPSESPENIPPEKGRDTSHFSIIDRHGNRVAATLSINYPFGSGFMVPGTGILLNDEMDDFSAKAGEPNAYELVSQSANAIAPDKRPLSSMTPAFVENDQQLLVIGTPGGSRIITMVLQGALHFIDGQTAEQIVAAPRLHHQYLPDQVSVESTGFTDEQIEALTCRGHQLNKMNRQFGNMQVITVNKLNGDTNAASDPRGEGAAGINLLPEN